MHGKVREIMSELGKLGFRELPKSVNSYTNLANIYVEVRNPYPTSYVPSEAFTKAKNDGTLFTKKIQVNKYDQPNLHGAPAPVYSDTFNVFCDSKETLEKVKDIFERIEG